MGRWTKRRDETGNRLGRDWEEKPQDEIEAKAKEKPQDEMIEGMARARAGEGAGASGRRCENKIEDEAFHECCVGTFK
eukprot:6677-Hanusia_phi.AAC.1